ncbi:hypothetical protein [Leeuwenhoekiella sp. MAR_2009_132]|uniref:hypothetical protein n=1 Tax=Leeuwenhoekiella sp. MAR_2009_132 TaxID=1392489 RepID=UPI00048E6F92|nr:hypothetical protein [Leeuwenhoekiella sp. MAR_2009_132]
MTRYIFSVIVILSANTFSQEIASIPLIDKINAYNIDEELNLIKSRDSLLYVVQRVASDVKITTFDAEYNQVKQVNLTDSPFKNYKILSSASVDNSMLFLLSGGIFKNRFSLISYNFQNQKFEEILQLQKFINEEFLGSFFIKDKLHLLTVSLDSQELSIYTISKASKISKKSYDFSHYKFKAPGFSDEKLKYLFYQKGISPIENNEIDSFLGASLKNKSYVFNQELWLTFDQDPELTRLIKFNLDNGKMALQDIPKPLSSEGRMRESNSFIKDKYIYQLALNKKEMILEVKNLESGLMDYRFSVKEDENIGIRNTEVRLRGAAYVKERVLEKTSQFIRKVVSSESAIFVRKINDTIQMRIGANRSSYPGVIMAGAVNFDGAPQNYLYSNPLPISDLSAVSDRWISFSAVFDSNFNHLDTETIPNLYDKIKDFKESKDLKKDIKDALIFFGENYIYSYVDKGFVKLVKF